MKTLENMKELKELLNKVPNNVLENFVIGNGDEGWAFGCSEATETGNELEMIENYSKHTKKYPVLKIIAKYFDEIIKQSSNEDGDIVWIDY